MTSLQKLYTNPHKNLLPFNNGRPCTRGTAPLTSMLNQNNFGSLKRDQQLQSKWGEGLLAGVAYLHSLGLVHGNLTLDCLYVDMRNDELLVGNLDGCMTPSQLKSLSGVSDLYAPPEKFSGGSMSRAADIWACGVILYYIFNKKFAFSKAVRPATYPSGCMFQWYTTFDAGFLSTSKYANLVTVLKQMLVTLPGNRMELVTITRNLYPLVKDFSDVKVSFD